jgi:uncharacterized membrane protein
MTISEANSMMRQAVMIGALAATLALPGGIALAQSSGGQGAAAGDQGKAGMEDGTNSAKSNCPAGLNQAGCEDTSRLGSSGSSWGTGDSSGSAAMGTTGSYGRSVEGPQPGQPPTVKEPDNTSKSK